MEGWHRASPGLFVLLGFLAGALGPAATVPEVPGFPAPWRLWAPLRIPLKARAAPATWWARGFRRRHVAVGLEGKSLPCVDCSPPSVFFSSESGGIGQQFTALRVSVGTPQPYPKCRHNHSLKNLLHLQNPQRWIPRFFNPNLVQGLSFPFNSKKTKTKNKTTNEQTSSVQYKWCVWGGYQ